MVVGLVELEMVVLVVDERLAAIARTAAPARDLQADAVRARLEMPVRSVDAIAVRQQEVGRSQRGSGWRIEPDQTRADQQPALAALLRQIDQFVAPRGGDDGMSPD